MGSRLEAKSSAVRKRIEAHTFEDEAGDEYGASSFGGFPEYFRRKKIKLQNLDAERRAHAVGKPAIFRGIVCHVNGYTQPSLNDLHAMLVDHGGGFIQYLDGKTMVTHIIASNLTPKKKVEFRRYRIVKPAWVVDSIKAGRLLPWENYRVVDEGIRQNVLGVNQGSLVSQANAQNSGYRDQTDTSWYTSQLQTAARQLEGQIDSLPDQEPATSLLHDRAPPALNVDSKARSEPSKASGSPEVDLSPSMHIQPELAPNAALQVDPKTLDNVSNDAATQSFPSEFFESPNLDEETTTFETPAPSIAREDPNPTVPSVPSDDLKTDDAPVRKPMTAEEHNAILLQNPKVWKSTVVNPGFLKQYYEESRLHHLSTWKAELKSRLQAQAQEQTALRRLKRRRVPGSRRYILHVDFDSFFAAVSLRPHPEWKDLPCVVAHGGGAGAEIASCNYPARTFGVKNGMWMKTAQQLCPQLKVLPYDFKAYEAASKEFYAAILEAGGVVQSVSIDEALVDVSEICIESGGSDGKSRHEGSVDREQQTADKIARNIRDQVLERTGCHVSVGIGSNILQAKTALRKAKPAGQYQLRPEDVLDFLGPLSVQDLPGVAYSMGRKLEEIGVKLVRDIRELSKDRLINAMGPKTGERLWDYARGIDGTEVGDQVIRKSVSAEVNWGVRFSNQEQADEFIGSLCEELSKRLLNEGVRGRQLTMKIMRKAAHVPMDPPKHLGHGPCDVFNKSVPLGVSTYDSVVLSREALSILKAFNFPPGELRGLGVQVTKLEPLRNLQNPTDSSQRSLTFDGAAVRKKQDASLETKEIADDAPGSKPVGQQRQPLQDASFPDDDLVDHRPDALEGFDKQVSATTAAPKLKRRMMMDISGQHRPIDPADVKSNDMSRRLTPAKPKLKTEISSTQFFLPSQVDPAILAELPPDIRDRLAPRDNQDDGATSGAYSANSPKQADKRDADLGQRSFDEPLSASQLDPEILAALPEDVRDEILTHYRRRSPSASSPAKVLLTPQAQRTVQLPKKSLVTPTKRRPGLASRGRGRGRARPMPPGYPTLTQANFVQVEDSEGPASDYEGDIAPDVLAALPEDIRMEILEQQRRERLKKRGALDVQNRKKIQRKEGATAQRLLHVRARPPRPTFTSQRLSSLPALREAVTAWVEAFQHEEPNDEDVEALSDYLRRVVIDELDMSKAIAVAQWLVWSIDQLDPDAAQIWHGAVESIRQAVTQAIAQRGLGTVVI